MAKKPRATWVAKRSKGWPPLKKGKLIAEDGTTLAVGLTLSQAKERFPAFVIRDADKRTDPLDYRLPGSYGSRQ
jgi:hypothetical protein